MLQYQEAQRAIPVHPQVGGQDSFDFGPEMLFLENSPNPPKKIQEWELQQWIHVKMVLPGQENYPS